MSAEKPNSGVIIDDLGQDQNFLERNDRSFRAYSVEVVLKLAKSRVLLTPLNGPNTELMKNLVLDCVGVTVADEGLVTSQDIECNFMLGPVDLGKDKTDVLIEKFKDMNPYAKLEKRTRINIDELYEKEIQLQDKKLSSLANFDIIAVSTTSFREMKLWDRLCTHLNKPLFILNCSGLYGFIWINLGPDYQYVALKQKVEVFSIVDGQYKKVSQEQKDEYETVYVKCLTLDEALGQVSKNKTLVYYAIQMMAKAEEQGLFIDPYNLDESVLEKIINIGKSIYTETKNDFDEKCESFLRNFARLYGVEYCPVYSIIGSVASQEFTKVISRRNDPSLNWFCYDSQVGYGKVDYVQNIEEFKRTLIKDQMTFQTPRKILFLHQFSMGVIVVYVFRIRLCQDRGLYIFMHDEGV